jgi:hypothetical protein
MNKQEAISRLDALDAEAKALRAIIEAEPKKEPRGLCWVSRGMYARRIRLICGHIGDGRYYDDAGDLYDKATPLADSELQEYRGRRE